jgi:hypothetical protein
MNMASLHGRLAGAIDTYQHIAASCFAADGFVLNVVTGAGSTER